MHDELEEEILALDEIRASTVGGNLVIAKARLFMTMIDQKVLNNIMDIPMHSCGLCGAGPSDFMQICNYDTQLFQPYADALNFGISPLHAWINFMNHLLKLSCHQPIRSNRACGEVNKQICRDKKEEIHRKLFERIGIKVGVPNPNGPGNSNTGNCARRAFENPAIFAEILELDEQIVTDFKTILICISSRHRINPEPFKNFCRDLHVRYYEKYYWYNISPTIHKVWAHGHELARHFPVAFNMLSEEGAESKHSDHKRMKRDHTRKDDWNHTMHDFFYRSMDMSDPMLTKIAIERAAKYQRFHFIPEEARALLIIEDGDGNLQPDADYEDEDRLHGEAFESALDSYDEVNGDLVADCD